MGFYFKRLCSYAEVSLGFEFRVVVNTSRTTPSLGSNDRAGWWCLRGEGQQLASDQGPQHLLPAPLFVWNPLRSVKCFCALQAAGSLPARVPQPVTDWLVSKSGSAQGKRNPVPLGGSLGGGQGLGLKHHCALVSKFSS